MSNKLDYLGTLDGFEQVTKNVGAQNTKTINYQRLNYKLNYLTSLYHTRGRYMLHLYFLDIWGNLFLVSLSKYKRDSNKIETGMK